MTGGAYQICPGDLVEIVPGAEGAAEGEVLSIDANGWADVRVLVKVEDLVFVSRERS